jgi:hypothetical protein
MGYNLEWSEPQPPTRLSTRDFCLKKSIFWRYALDDSQATFTGGLGAGLLLTLFALNFSWMKYLPAVGAVNVTLTVPPLCVTVMHAATAGAIHIAPTNSEQRVEVTCRDR